MVKSGLLWHKIFEFSRGKISDDTCSKETVMRNTKHPNFILGIFTLILLFIGIGLKANGYRSGDYVLIGGIALGAIHWIWSITDVFRHQHTNSQSRVLWQILVIVIPPVGGLLYYAMSKTVRM